MPTAVEKRAIISINLLPNLNLCKLCNAETDNRIKAGAINLPLTFPHKILITENDGEK